MRDPYLSFLETPHLPFLETPIFPLLNSRLVSSLFLSIIAIFFMHFTFCVTTSSPQIHRQHTHEYTGMGPIEHP